MSSVSVYITLYNYVSTYIKADVRWYKAPEYHITWCLNYQLFARPSSVCNVASARKGVFQHPFTQWPKRVCISAGIGHFCWSERSGTTNLARFFFGFSPSKIIFKPHKSPHPKLWSVYLRLVFFYLSWGFLSSQIVQTKESSSWDFYSSAQPMALSWISGWWFRRKIPERSEIYHLVMTDIAMERSTIFNR